MNKKCCHLWFKACFYCLCKSNGECWFDLQPLSEVNHEVARSESKHVDKFVPDKNAQSWCGDGNGDFVEPFSCRVTTVGSCQSVLGRTIETNIPSQKLHGTVPKLPRRNVATNVLGNCVHVVARIDNTSNITRVEKGFVFSHHILASLFRNVTWE